MSATVSLALGAVVVVVASLLGGGLAVRMRLTHRRLQVLISFVSGLILAIALLHLFPHALQALSPWSACGWLLAGLLVMFLLERIFHHHHHELAEVPSEAHGSRPTEENSDHVAEPHPNAQGCHPAHAEHEAQSSAAGGWTWKGVTLGMTLHSLIAGAAWAASIVAETQSAHRQEFWPGLALLAVIVLHKPLDSMTVMALARRSGLRGGRAWTVNLLFALTVPLGATLFWLAFQSVDPKHHAVTGAALAFSAGLFLCIALSDLLPELQFHRHDKVALTVALALGVALGVGITLLESTVHHHDHSSHDHSSHDQRQPHGHHQHGHHQHGHDHHDHGGTPVPAADGVDSDNRLAPSPDPGHDHD